MYQKKRKFRQNGRPSQVGDITKSPSSTYLGNVTVIDSTHIGSEHRLHLYLLNTPISMTLQIPGVIQTLLLLVFILDRKFACQIRNGRHLSVTRSMNTLISWGDWRAIFFRSCLCHLIIKRVTNPQTTIHHNLKSILLLLLLQKCLSGWCFSHAFICLRLHAYIAY